jgi:hypothetical protein
LHSDSSIYGKINIRATANIDILNALLGGIKVGQVPSTWAGGTELTYTSSTTGEVPTLANAIFGSSERPFLTRAQVAKVGALSDASLVAAQTTDATKEEVIGKFINLTKTELAEEFMIIVLAQSIKDVGGVTMSKDLNNDGSIGDNETDTYDADGDGSVVDTIDEKDVLTNYRTYNPMFDEILSEQKILVRVKYDATAAAGSRWRITRYEYIEE